MPLTFLDSQDFLYGPGLFETFRLNGEGVTSLKEHWERLEKSAKTLGLPFHFNKQEMLKEISKLGINYSGKIFRLTYKLENEEEKLFLQAIVPKPRPALWTLATKTIFPFREASHKSTNRKEYQLDFEKSQLLRCTDMVYISSKNILLETTRANIFLVINETLATPENNGTILPGIVRKRILKAASSLGIYVQEREIKKREIAEASEIFVTNSVIGIAPVCEIKGIWKTENASHQWSSILLEMLKK